MKIEETKKKSASGTNTYRERSFSEGDKNTRWIAKQKKVPWGIRQYNNFY